MLDFNQIPTWKVIEDSLKKDFHFIDFKEAFSFLVKVGFTAEKMNHHPTIWNVYNKVSLQLDTHDSKSITQKDIDLAIEIDKLIK